MSSTNSATSTLAGTPETPDKARSHSDPEKGFTQTLYKGEGTEASPYIVTWQENDPENPLNFSSFKKWMITLNAAFATLCVAFASSVYSGGIRQMMVFFGKDLEVLTLGISLFVLGFAFGPLLWAPFSEQWGRRNIFLISYFPFVLFNIGCARAQNIETMLICRFFAGFFGSSPLTNSGGVISDMFSPAQRALGISVFALCPFAGPVLGPIVGSFIGVSTSWRWIFYVLIIFSFIMFVLGFLNPETYAPVLLRNKAAKLQKENGHVYRSQFDLHPMFAAPLPQKMKTAIARPFVLLFKESIVLLMSLYAAFIYGVLYLFFGAIPIVFTQDRGWSPGIASLAFIGIGLGMVTAVILNVFENKRYVKNLIANGGSLPPEARLPLCCVAGVMLPAGLFWFAWTTQPSVHWIVPIIASFPFGCAMVLIFLSMFSYLIDVYYVFAASALAANAVLRSLLGFAFPLFTRSMFDRLGTQWALTLLAFLALLFTPVPFLFLFYGDRIRAKSTFAPGHKPAAAPATTPAAVESTLSRKTTDAHSTHSVVRSMQEELDQGEVIDREDEMRQEKKDGVYEGKVQA
ncbi:MFS transporter [Sporobolomyces salmoneus]|uniref:MFS transporter n=1 Tax=Sporobolomyces salmoneus TaxID=183962 RepID=UPI0031823425